MKGVTNVISWLIICCIGANSYAANFSDSLNWQQLQAKAKVENKYIFVDCYASWCGPCKAMEQIFQKKAVADFVKAHFICIRVQMDSTSHDDGQIKAWYADAHRIMQKYKVKVFPSYLFFAPNGKILHKDIGFKDEQGFLQVLNAALDPGREYYALLEDYQHNKKDFSRLPYLIEMSRRLGNRELANDLLKDYVQEFLYSLDEQQLYDKKRLRFIAAAMQSSKERGFELFFKHSDKIDEIVGEKSYAYRVVERIIYREEVDTAVSNCLMMNDKTPDWKMLENLVEIKYGNNYAKNVILDGKIRWYNVKKDWTELARCIIDRVELIGVDTTGGGLIYLNNILWVYVFERCIDHRILKKAINLEKRVVQLRPLNSDYLDTYANLLYRVGNITEALQWENKAIALEPNNKDHLEALEKMKRGEPTWTGPGND